MKNELVKIGSHDISIKEYQGKRVTTFKDIDECHERPEGTAKRNFNENKPHFNAGEDYFFVKPADIRKDEIRTSEINNSGTYLITESGYMMLVKSFTDDLAWNIQRELVNTYFNRQGKPEAISSDPSKQLRAEAMVTNAKSRQVKMLLSMATETDEPLRKQTLQAYATKMNRIIYYSPAYRA